MARTSKRAALLLTPEQKVTLKELAASRTAPAREVERAKVLLGYADGSSITQLQRQLGFGRPMIYRCIDKALAAGVQMGLKDKYHRPHEPEITDEAKAWVVSIACTQYCLVRKNSWFGIAWLIDRVPSFPCPIVAGSLFDSSNISFASTRHSAAGSHLT